MRDLWHTRENQKLKHRFFCSQTCSHDFHRRGAIYSCENLDCKNKIYRAQRETSPHNYCSRSCAVKINNKKFPKRGSGPRFCAKNGCSARLIGETKYCSKKCREGIRRRFTKQKLIEIIHDLTKKLGRVPVKRDALDITYACVYYFGSWNRAIIVAGLNPHRSHENRMYKRQQAQSIDGHLCDSISELLIDNWFMKNGIPHERNAQYPGATQHLADWKVGSVFVEYFGLANDSPRYDRSIKRKKEICARFKVPLIEIYANDLYPQNILDSSLRKKLGLLFTP